MFKQWTVIALLFVLENGGIKVLHARPRGIGNNHICKYIQWSTFVIR